MLNIVACARAEPTPTHGLTVPNIDADSPPCVLKVPTVNPQCTSEGCTFFAPDGSKLNSIELRFSCLPKSALTGFERPAPEAKVQTLNAQNAGGNFSLRDDVYAPPNERFRNLLFCLYGKFNNFCGSSTVTSLEYRTKVKATRTVKEFLQGVELQDPQIFDSHR
jgi:hypothetical protein